MIPTRSVTQIRSHAQKYFMKKQKHQKHEPSEETDKNHEEESTEQKDQSEHMNLEENSSYFFLRMYM